MRLTVHRLVIPDNKSHEVRGCIINSTKEWRPLVTMNSNSGYFQHLSLNSKRFLTGSSYLSEGYMGPRELVGQEEGESITFKQNKNGNLNGICIKLSQRT